MENMYKYAMIENVSTLLISASTVVLCDSAWGLLGLLFLINLNTWKSK